MSLPNTPEKFWNRVNIGEPNTCWEWQGAYTSSGYGNLKYQGTHVVAHRLAYHLAVSPIPLTIPDFNAASIVVLHSCDNRKCCNPAHLSLGTNAINQLEAYQRGRKRQPKGSDHANSKLTDHDVKNIRAQYKVQHTQVELAKIYNVSQRCISLITRKETYVET